MAEWISPEAFKNYAETFAIFVGGGWAYWRFVLRRERESALSIALTHEAVPRPDGNYIVFLDVAFTNQAVVRLTAARSRCPAYKDESEVLNFSGSLLLRALPTDSPANAQVRWFSGALDNSPRSSDIEVDLLDEFSVSGETDFWMEPGECSHSGVTVILPPGLYLAMITFIGSEGVHEFWRRTFFVHIACGPPTANAQNAANS